MQLLLLLCTSGMALLVPEAASSTSLLTGSGIMIPSNLTAKTVPLIKKNTTLTSQWDVYFPRARTEKGYCPAMPEFKVEGGPEFVATLWNATAAQYQGACNKVQRVGGAGDGGKEMCADSPLKKDCVIYSLGSRLEFSFELAAKAQTGCQIFTFDCTVGSPDNPAVKAKIPKNVQFYNWCVGGKDEAKAIQSDLGYQGEVRQFYTLDTIKSKLKHETVDILKMDIERHEFGVFPSITSTSAPAQILFEVHLHDGYGTFNNTSVTAQEYQGVWTHLGQLGYEVFAHEPNPTSKCCCEYSVQRPQGSGRTKLQSESSAQTQSQSHSQQHSRFTNALHE